MGFGIYPKRWVVKKNTLIDNVTKYELGKSTYLTMSARQIAEYFKLHPKGRGASYWKAVTGWTPKMVKEFHPRQTNHPKAEAALSKHIKVDDTLLACYIMLLRCIKDEKQHRRILSEAWDKSVEKKRAKQKSHKNPISALPAFAPKK
jgi:hypothetical protein